MVITSLAIVPFSAFADESGKCGDNVNYYFDSASGTLTVSGTGPMYDASGEYDPPTCNNTGVKSIVIEDGVTGIGIGAFAGCPNADTVVIGETVETIGAWAFYDCDGINELNIPASVTTIGDSAFKGCGAVQTLVLRSGLQSIGNEAFRDCKFIMDIQLPYGVTTIGENAFYNTGIWEIRIPETVTSIGSGAFNGCKNLAYVFYDGSADELNNLIAPRESSNIFGLNPTYYFAEGKCGENVNYMFDYDNGRLEIYGYGDMDDYASPYMSPFSFNSRIKEIEFSDGIRRVGSYAFGECEGLTKVDLNSVHEIGEGAFCGCISLKSVTIPTLVNTFEPRAFADCSALETVNYNCHADIREYTFNGCMALKNFNIGGYPKYCTPDSFNGTNDTFTVTSYCDVKAVPTIIEGTNRTWVKEHYNVSEVVGTTATTYIECVYCSVCGEANFYKHNKSANKLTAKGKTKTLKYKSLKKKNLTVKRADAITLGKKNGTVTYTKASGNKKITVNKKTGNITVKKGLKKGTYKVKVKVRAAGTQKIKAKTVTVTVTIKVK